ncbi:MAG TPA: thioredoxin domain-containing protein [Tepidiformaceae bacterium]|nr:thioredoxin domain-containing protein [Tepidiformaceae bacterium]HMO95594.1 thioredoxin domain-containing protein [Tepidiformaceae bacterium]
MRFSANSALPLLAAAILAFSAACGSGSEAGPATATPTPESIADRVAGSPIEGLPVEGTFIGRADAPVLIEMYEDFGCPHCLAFTADLEPHLLEDYVKPGKVRLQYRFFPLRQLTANAAIAAYCASEQDLFWPYHKELFLAQAEASAGSGPPLTEAFDIPALRSLAGELGLDLASFDACTSSDRVIDVVTEDLRMATELNLPGTPSFVINGEVIRNVPNSRQAWSDLLEPLIRK